MVHVNRLLNTFRLIVACFRQFFTNARINHFRLAFVPFTIASGLSNVDSNS